MPIVVWICVMFGYPAYDTVRMAFSYVSATNFVTGHWRWAGLENFRTLPYVEGWNLTLRNTALFIAGSVIPQFVIGGLLAVALRENSHPGDGPGHLSYCLGFSRSWRRRQRSSG